MNLSNSPTLSAAATQQGVILGTAAYMSPEQARGNPVDKRADIWAFGVVLFEMLTGRPIFSEDTVSDTLASVLKIEPEWQHLPQNLHPRIRLLLERCLEKDPKNRYHDIADARVDIQSVLADPSGVFVQPVTEAVTQTMSRSIIPWIVAILGIVIVGAAVWYLKPTEPKRVMRFDYELPEGQRLSQNDLDVHLGLAVRRQGDNVSFDRLAVHVEGDRVPRACTLHGNVVGSAAKDARGLESGPVAWNDRSDLQSGVGRPDAQDPLGDGDIVVGSGAGEPRVLGLAVGWGVAPGDHLGIDVRLAAM